MSTFQKCPESVRKLANSILEQYETHRPVIDAGVKIDFLFAYAKVDEKTGEPVGDALKCGGEKVLGICRKVALKDRVMDRGDVEITLDGDWWPTASDDEQRGLLDHELHHISVKIDKRGLVRDDIGRPVIALRRHDVVIGWFKVIAARNENSPERIQARQIMLDNGQYFWPDLNTRLLAAERKELQPA